MGRNQPAYAGTGVGRSNERELLMNLPEGWSPRNDGGFLRIVDGLGLVEVYRTRQHGNACFINGKVAWSAWREPLPNMLLKINQDIRQWQYLNEFAALRAPTE